MPARVIDASLLAAWCFREDKAADALDILLANELYAPLLLAYELANIARKKAMKYPVDADNVANALETALALPIHWNEVNHLAVLQLALETHLTTYDSSYLYLVRKLGVPLATFDERLYEVASRG